MFAGQVIDFRLGAPAVSHVMGRIMSIVAPPSEWSGSIILVTRDYCTQEQVNRSCSQIMFLFHIAGLDLDRERCYLCSIHRNNTALITLWRHTEAMRSRHGCTEAIRSLRWCVRSQEGAVTEAPVATRYIPEMIKKGNDNMTEDLILTHTISRSKRGWRRQRYAINAEWACSNSRRVQTYEALPHSLPKWYKMLPKWVFQPLHSTLQK